ncbi:response regulator transcription factor [Shinella sp. CPCC 101442]|uniref:helix-turn-helix transcriptional regulator n=1 Tax=Shinella sp. CPCC 101442 TaxID=2932265 RepID=UPI0021526CB1|nr:response regulator transcription factor [Shinella sp. CPCC 101442]MCR6502426.1 response regulator transcription factor [Shinella sp. CPCC 101442]
MAPERRSNSDAFSATPFRTDVVRTILIVGPSEHTYERLAAFPAEFPQTVILHLPSVEAACKTFANPVGLILIDSALRPATEAAAFLLRRLHPDAQIALTHPTMSETGKLSKAGRGQSVYLSLLPMDLALNIWLAVVRLLLSGGEYFPVSPSGPKMGRHHAAGGGQAFYTEADTPIKLTPREMEILEKAAQGMQNKLIAVEFNLSENTVKVHLHNIISKLGVHNRTEAAAKYHQLLSAIQEK